MRYIILYSMLLLVCVIGCQRQAAVEQHKTTSLPYAIENAYATKDFLVCWSMLDKAVYVWRWADLQKDVSAKPKRYALEGVSCLAVAVVWPHALVDRDDYLVWLNLETGKDDWTQKIGPEFFTMDLRASPGGRYVAVRLAANAGQDTDKYGVFDVDKQAVRWLAEREHHLPTNVAVTDDGKLLAVSNYPDNNDVLVLDVETGKTAMTAYAEDSAGLDSIMFSPDGKELWYGGTMAYLFSYDLGKRATTRKWLACRKDEPVYGHRMSSIGMSADGKYVAAGTCANGELFIWNLADGSRRAYHLGKDRTVYSCVFSPDNKLAVASTMTHLHIIRLE